MTDKIRELNDRQKAVIETIRMRLNEKQALTYLKEVNFKMSARTYYREKRIVESLKLKRLYHIASLGFVDQHLDRIDNIELCLRLMWENYNKEPDPYKRFQMLKDIILVQPYLSSYYETTKLVMQQQQPSATTKIDSNNNIDDNQEGIRLDRESYSEDDNRKF
jgi:hypothetical protein